MKKLRAKAIQQTIHAKSRFLERFGAHLTTAELQRLVYQIQNNNAKFVSRTSKRVTLWDLMFKDQYIRVVYDNQRKTIVTCYAPEDPVCGKQWEIKRGGR